MWKSLISSYIKNYIWLFLVDRYEITVSQMKSDMFLTILFPFHECDLPNMTIDRVWNNMSNTTGATCGARSAYPSRESEMTPICLWGSCCLLFSFLCCVLWTIICLFVFFLFSHGVVSFYYIYEFGCPSGIFRPSLIWICQQNDSIVIINRS